MCLSRLSLVRTASCFIVLRMDNGKAAVAAQDSVVALDEQAQRSLLMRVAQGDETAFASLYDRTSTRVYALARRIVQQPPLAEEVVSDVYLQVWQQAARYDAGRGKVLTWILMICRSRALDALRRRDPAAAHPEPQQLRPDLYQDDEQALDVLAATETNTRLYEALEILNDKERHLLNLAFFQGLTHQDIATKTHMPLGTVKTVLRKAMLSLRQHLGPTSLLEDA